MLTLLTDRENKNLTPKTSPVRIYLFKTLSSCEFQKNSCANSMIFIKKIFPPLMALFVVFGLHFQSTAAIPDSVYKTNIRSVLFQGSDREQPYPVFFMGQTESLILQFDDLDGEMKDFQYTIVHCNYDWKPSQLLRNEYIDGYFTDYITDNESSFNTYVSYTNYRLKFPNLQMRPKISGNYILKIYENGNEDDLVITLRFFVVEPAARIEANVVRPNLTTYFDSHHEVDFNVDVSRLNAFNPTTDYKVLIMQNGRWDNAIWNLEPRFYSDQELIYNYERENVFPAGNEYRIFDTRDVRFGGRGIEQVAQDSFSLYNALLYRDKIREGIGYVYTIDADGHFIIASKGTRDDQTESDYIWVHFRLESTYDEGDVYVFGGLSNWKLKERFKLRYNRKKRQYEGKILLKQGFYNYVYANSANGKADIASLEGNYFQTENEYEIFFYQYNMDRNCDILVGYQLLNSDFTHNGRD